MTFTKTNHTGTKQLIKPQTHHLLLGFNVTVLQTRKRLKNIVTVNCCNMMSSAYNLVIVDYNTTNYTNKI